MAKILITGANGFIGKELCSSLKKRGHDITAAIRSRKGLEGICTVDCGDIQGETNWDGILGKGFDVVVHLASRVHILQEDQDDPLTAYRKVNVEGTHRLAQSCLKFGVKKFVFFSSIKVNGEENNVPYTENDPPRPVDPYGISKWEAEQALQNLTGNGAMDLVILRPPLVYGAGVKANFDRLIRLVLKSVPLPFKDIHNRRSFVFLGNLVDATTKIIERELPIKATYLISDGQDCSTAELMAQMARILGIRIRLFSFPPSILRIMLKMLGKEQISQRILGSLTVDNNKIRKDLSWEPPYTMEEGLRYALSDYMKKTNSLDHHTKEGE